MTGTQEAPVGRLVGLILTATLMIIAGCASTAKPAGGTSVADTQPGGSAVRMPAVQQGPAAPPTSVQIGRRPWRFAAYEGSLISTAHYRIHTTLEYDHILQRLPVFMEHAIERYTTALADLPEPGRPLETYLFHDRRQWMAKTRQILPHEAATFDALGRGGFTTRGIAVLYYIDHNGRYRDTFAIAAHEGWHQYTQSTFRQPLPIWLEEGIATYMEGHQWGEEAPRFIPSRNWERRGALRRAIRADALIPLDDLLTRAPQFFLEENKDRLLTYYGQVWALTRFLADGADGRYREALAELLTDAARGRLGHRLSVSLSTRPAAAPTINSNRPRRSRRVALNDLGTWLVKTYFDEDVAAFEEAYFAYARALAEGGPVRGPRRGRRAR
ncbi:MAG: hypothetical protein SYC29_17620 [Planctomycetota bacterium]|nr:hypothetical protein [Planctomycetota bacterium]